MAPAFAQLPQCLGRRGVGLHPDDPVAADVRPAVERSAAALVFGPKIPSTATVG